MGRSAKGADAMNEAVTRGIRMAAKRTFPKGKGVGPPFWTPELTKLDVAQREPSSDTAPDDDEVNCEELKQLGRETKKCVVRLLNCSLRTGQVPAKWGHGIIVPLLKPNKPTSSMASFRPATLTSTLRKLMERIVARRVRDCIEDKLQPQRAVFRPARSTQDTLMQVTSAVWRRKGGEKRAAAFIDCACAIDSVDHGCIVKVLVSFAMLRGIWLRGSRVF
ncbi:putative Reverse transcriptase (RNA dependent DNA polymerase) [Trypanosoma vivax]|uniref:Retrotransposon hot spot protein (RHS), putative n=1 Tax=Trypanosoma vivax (strain Y486) TaxID=1055687 RepID=F9WUV8_TRYVY